LPVPILAIVATDDPMVPVDQVRGWARHTSAGFTLRVLPGGGHLFLRERQQEVTELIRIDLDGAIRSAPSPAGYGTAASPGSDRATR
jgi:surfactin synthase thioesterase subunit